MGSQQLATSLCNDVSLSMFIFSGNEPNGEPSTSRTGSDVHDETDFSMASLAKREVTKVCVGPLPPN